MTINQVFFLGSLVGGLQALAVHLFRPYSLLLGFAVSLWIWSVAVRLLKKYTDSKDDCECDEDFFLEKP